MFSWNWQATNPKPLNAMISARTKFLVATRGVPIFAYANNHYAGNGPATVRLFQEFWNERPESKTRPKGPGNLPLF